MLITKYGRSTLIWYFAGLVLVVAVLWFGGMNRTALYIVVSVLAVLTFLVINFFRDPDRAVPAGPGLVLAPADGKIIAIGAVDEPLYLKGPALRVCIFMSPLDVHVNRFPVSGRVGFKQHLSGRFMPAFRDKASEDNERTLIGIEDGGVKVLFKQIAGSLARRIVADVEVGQSAVAGERFGMIRFGSRVDVLMPPTARVRVKVDDRAVAGETVLADISGTE